MKLYPYQEEYISDLPKDCIMGADVGTGKTYMSIAHYKKHSEGKPLLVLAPASKVKTKDWQRDLVQELGVDQEWWVESYDKFARRPINYLGVDNLCVIADEVHFVCNSQTKRGKAVQKLKRMSDQFIGLSASPLPNGWKSMENFAIMFGLSRNKTEFVRTYQNIDRSRGFPIITSYNHVDRMEKFWNSIAKPLNAEGNINLPRLAQIPMPIEMPEKGKAEYGRMKRTRIAPDGELLDSPSKLFARLRQSITPHRIDTLKSILDSTNEHIVVFYNYDVEREAILNTINKLEDKRVVYEQSGHASNLPPKGTWDKLKPSITLAQYQSASTAIELQYASVTVFFSPTYSYANFYQAKGRTRRIGQKRRTVFYYLSVQGTIDQAVWLALRGKQDFNIQIWYDKEVTLDKT